MTNKAIIQELSDLGSSLVGEVPQNLYSVPSGYFEGLAGEILGIIKANEYVALLPKKTPYQPPVGYFEGLEERIMEGIRVHADYQTSKEELEALSPLLGSLNKRPVYSVPQGYFENFKVDGKESVNETKVVSIRNRKWFSYAAAAVVILAFVGIGLFVNSNNHNDSATKSLAKFEKEVKKIDDVKKTESLIDLMDDGLNEKEVASNSKVKTEDVQQLLQDVSTDELKDFNEQSKAIEDVMMTN